MQRIKEKVIESKKELLKEFKKRKMLKEKRQQNNRKWDDIKFSDTIREEKQEKYHEIKNELIKIEEKTKNNNIKIAILQNNIEGITRENIKNMIIEELTKYIDKNVGEKTKEKIQNKLIADIEDKFGLTCKLYYSKTTYASAVYYDFSISFYEDFEIVTCKNCISDNYQYKQFNNKLLGYNIHIPFEPQNKAFNNYVIDSIEYIEIKEIQKHIKELLKTQNKVKEMLQNANKIRDDFNMSIKSNLYELLYIKN